MPLTPLAQSDCAYPNDALHVFNCLHYLIRGHNLSLRETTRSAQVSAGHRVDLVVLSEHIQLALIKKIVHIITGRKIKSK